MSVPGTRPDPDFLLARLREEEDRKTRGKLKVFFGFAPGVGKTYRMLQVARELITDRHYAPTDVVLGIIETHGRYDTQGLVLGLEILPRKRVEYRGHVLEEFDLDGALVRRPKVLLLDELAHTNAPGLRHAKRYQDVEELLSAGINVLTTMNVQHLESLNDVIAQITRIQVRETIPDSVLDNADSVELIDITPEELLERLSEGKVYVPEQAQRATEHFFRRGNLLALRELALRRTAQHVDESVLEYRQSHRVVSTWPASERILVCVGPAPSSVRLVRAAARMAAGLRCPWVASYVESTSQRALTEVDRERLEVHLRIAESLGASVQRLTGMTVAEGLIAFAKQHNVTKIIIGKPTHSRLRDILRGSLLNDVVRGSGDIDVHVISGDADERAAHKAERSLPSRAPSGHYVSAGLIVLCALGLALLFRAAANLPDLEMLFVLAVMVTAARFGRGPSLAAAALGVACYDFFFVPPFHTFSVHDRRYFLTFLMMFGVGFVISELASRIRRQELAARGREENTSVLYALARELGSTDNVLDIAAAASRHAARVFGAKAFVLTVSAKGELQLACATPADAVLDGNVMGVAKWTCEHDEYAGLGTDTLSGAQALCAPLRAGLSRLGVLALVPLGLEPLRGEQRVFLEIFSRQVAIALERARLSELARQSALRAKSEEVRATLLSAVSHDLRTPLASITGAATALRDDQHLSTTTRVELVDSIVDQAEHLERLVANLLDMTRLELGEVTLRKDWVPLEEVIGSALTRLEKRLEGREVKVSIQNGIPLLLVDPVLIEQLMVNLLENADKYAPHEASIGIAAQDLGEAVAIEVTDEGPGFAKGEEDRVFEKFYRGKHVGISGVGLGLPICKGIAEVHGGTITAGNRATGGAVLRIVIPYGGIPPTVSPLAQGSQ